MARSANLTTTKFLVFKEDLVEAAILAVRRSLWEAANADFAAAVLIEALIYVFTTTM
jgi:putative heme iron utilization protein